MKFPMMILLVFCAVYVALVSVMIIFQRSLLYVPNTAKLSPPAGVEIVQTTTDDTLNLTHWLRPSAHTSRGIIIYFHGNGGHMGDRIMAFPNLHKNGFDLLVTGYRGYAGNAGSPSEDGLYRDAESVMAWALSRYETVILFGESLGTGVAVEMATRYPDRVSAMILESPYTSIPDMVVVHYPFVPFAQFLVRDKFSTIHKVGALKMPIMVAVAGDDRVIPPTNSRKVYDETAAPKTWTLYEGASHVALLPHGLERDVMAFLNAHQN